MTICRGTEAALRRPAEPWDSHAVLQAGSRGRCGGRAADTDFCGGVIPTRSRQTYSKRICLWDLAQSVCIVFIIQIVWAI